MKTKSIFWYCEDESIRGGVDGVTFTITPRYDGTLIKPKILYVTMDVYRDGTIIPLGTFPNINAAKDEAHNLQRELMTAK